MSISIIDNFQVGTSKPIDNRLVVGPGLFYTHRDDIQNKYTGLRIWDINDDKSYIWKSTIWVEETNGSSGTVGPGITGYIPKFTNSNIIGNSIMTETTGKINVNGILQANNLLGNGSGITSINASNITSGTLNPARLVGGSDEVLVSNGTRSNWTKLNTLTVGASNKVFINSIASNFPHYLTFTSTNSSSQQLFSNISLAYQPSTGNLSISTTNFNNKLTVNGSVSIGTTEAAPASGLLVSGSVRFSGLDQYVENGPKLSIVSNSTGNLMTDTGTTIPLGGIIMWMTDDIPSGFVLCDGETYESSYYPGGIETPNLSGSLNGINFIMYIGQDE